MTNSKHVEVLLMNGADRNGGYMDIYHTPATYGPATTWGTTLPCPDVYSGHDCSVMCDVCDMLRNIQSVVSDTNKMVKNIYHKIHREAPKTSPESNTK